GPLAALAAAHHDGRLDNYRPDATGLTAADLLACGVTLVDVPALPAGDAAVRHVLDLAVNDDQIGTAARILLVGTGDGTDRLAGAAFLGAPFAPGLLTSPEVGRPPYLQLVDVPATVLASFRPDSDIPASFIGRPAAFVPVAGSVADRLDAARSAARATEVRASHYPGFVALLLGAQLAGWLALLVAWRRSREPARRRALALSAGGLGLAGVIAPAASFLASLTRWQTSVVPMPLLVGSTLVASAGLAAAAARSRVRGPVSPVAAIAAVGTLVLAFDVLFSSRLQFNAALGYDAVTAGRFTGLGNLASGIFCAGVLLLLGALAARQATTKARVTVIAGGGAVAVAIVGAPRWGADAGGVLALLPALVVLGLLAARRRVGVAKVAVGAVAALVVVALIGLLDAARLPAQRTHLGRFVASLGDGTAGVTIKRRLSADLAMLAAPLPVLLIVACTAAAWWVFARPGPGVRSLFTAHPEVRWSLVAVTVAAALGLAVNDSGISFVAGAALVAAPALGAAAAYMWLAGHEERRAEDGLSDAVLP
ncbi:MAG: hypothetical protein JWM93_996, partial [Frankiales bacterium]|nr:hypothetical protein [Frankiales bacterium]